MTAEDDEGICAVAPSIGRDTILTAGTEATDESSIACIDASEDPMNCCRGATASGAGWRTVGADAGGMKVWAGVGTVVEVAGIWVTFRSTARTVEAVMVDAVGIIAAICDTDDVTRAG